MAELSTDPTAASSACCSTEAQATCCEPAAKDACCGEAETTGGGCGCAAGEARTSIRETVRETYAAAARVAAGPTGASSCCGSIELPDRTGREVFGAALYTEDDVDGATAGSVAASLGCGVPTAVADLALARANAAEAGVENAEFVKGYIEAIPLHDESVDVIVSNCVVNLSADKPQVFAEAVRVLRPGGRFAVSDVIAAPDMDDATRADMAAYTGCIAGALTEQEFRDGLSAAGFADVEIRETHRVHPHAVSALIRARKTGSRVA